MKLPNLTNFEEHPSEPEWIVFRFAASSIADEFVEELTRAGVKHERDTEGGPPFLVGVRKSQREAAVRLNYLVLGRHRSPFIADRYLRLGVFAFLALLIALAVAGALLR
jgi:hypothetical protein